MKVYQCEDVKLNFSDKKLAAFLRALIITEGRLTHTISFASSKRPPSRSDNWCCVVSLPDGQKGKFEEISGVKLRLAEVCGGADAT